MDSPHAQVKSGAVETASTRLAKVRVGEEDPIRLPEIGGKILGPGDTEDHPAHARERFEPDVEVLTAAIFGNVQGIEPLFEQDLALTLGTEERQDLHARSARFHDALPGHGNA